MTLLARVAQVLSEGQVPFALIGAGALSVHGVNRATHDHDLFTVEASCLRPDRWTRLAEQGAALEIRKGDFSDPLAGIVRFVSPGEIPVDLVVGKHRWQKDILDRVALHDSPDGLLPVVRAADLILLKLYAGGGQDGWDVQQLLDQEGDRSRLIAEVEVQLAHLPPHAAKLWHRVLDA